VELRGQQSKRPTRTVNNPSRMKIQDHPAFPPMPSMFSIAAASNPEKAPESEAAEKNNAILRDNYLRV